jgi:FtsH-binding integral membrane protein
MKSGISHASVIISGDRMEMTSNQRLAYTVVLGYVVILNLIGSSYLEFYPTRMLIGAAFGVGIAMVFGSMAYFLKEPKDMLRPRALKAPVPAFAPRPVARMRPSAAPS